MRLCGFIASLISNRKRRSILILCCCTFRNISMCFLFFFLSSPWVLLLFVQRESGAYTINMEKMDYLDKMIVLIELDATIMMTLTLVLYSAHPTKCLENSSVSIHHLQIYSVTVCILLQFNQISCHIQENFFQINEKLLSDINDLNLPIIHI